MTQENRANSSSSIWQQVNATRFIVATLGVLFALGGIDHGFFETLQGYTPTSGLIVQAIGVHNRMWVYGTEDAFTLIPNFLVSGIAAISVSLLITVWSIGFVHKKHGSLIFLCLFIALFLAVDLAETAHSRKGASRDRAAVAMAPGRLHALELYRPGDCNSRVCTGRARFKAIALYMLVASGRWAGASVSGYRFRFCARC